jgi:two-component system, sensor histidine kinase YesM
MGNKENSYGSTYKNKFFSFRNISITTKLALAFSFVFILMIMLSFINFANYREDKKASTLNVIKQTNSQTVNEVDKYVEDLNSITKFPLFEEINEDNFLNKLEIFNETNKSDLIFQKLVHRVFFKIFNYKSHIQSTFIFNLNGKNEYKMKGSAMYKEYNPSEQQWFQQSIDNFGEPVIISTFELPNVTDIHEKPVRMFSMARGIVRVEDAEVLGIIMVNTDVDFLNDICKKALIVPNQRIIIVDDEKNIVYDTVQSNITHKIEPEIFKAADTKTNQSEELTIDNIDFLISRKSFDNTNWTLINMIPVNSLNKNINQIRNNTILTTIILILIYSLFVLAISAQIVNPIRKLVKLMKNFQKGDFDAKINLKGHDEIGQLAETFDNMTAKIKKLINEVYEDKIKQKELELQMLQNQINPHFLYNTLEAIHMMAEINKDTETSKMARSLGKILRYSLKREKDTVTVYEEIAHTKEYVMLQKNRFDDIFTVEIDVNKSLYDKSVIKLLLQPIVENAIYHGLKKREKKGKIQVLGYKENNNMIFKVNDNGTGMSEKQVRLMNGYINDLNNHFEGIGLKNINKRIKLHYGSEYGITVISQPGIGTSIRAVLPLN